MLDDTTIREFLRDDYALVIDAVTLVTGDVTRARDTVHDALLDAWVQMDGSEPLDSLVGWVAGEAMGASRGGPLRVGADRRARTRLDHGADVRDVDEARVRGAMACLTWRQREVVSMRYVLRRSDPEIADALGLRTHSVALSLERAQDLLVTSLQLEVDADHPVDEQLADLVGGGARQLGPDPGLFERLVSSMNRKERVTRARRAGAAVAVVAIGALIFAVLGPSATGDDGEPPPSPPPPFHAATLPGVSFPACYVTVAHSFGGRGWFGLVYAFERGFPTGRCPALAQSGTYLALDRGGFGKHTRVFGPIECFGACRAFGTPDLDGDGWNEFAVVVVDGEKTDVIQLYRVNRRDAPQPFTPITTVSSGTRATMSVDWRSVGASRAGATCRAPRTSARWDVDVWHATNRDGLWHLVERRYRIHGAAAVPVGVRRSTVRDERRLPEGGALEFCGSLVSLT